MSFAICGVRSGGGPPAATPYRGYSKPVDSVLNFNCHALTRRHCHNEQVEVVFRSWRGVAKALESLSRAFSRKTVEASKTRAEGLGNIGFIVLSAAKGQRSKSVAGRSCRARCHPPMGATQEGRTEEAPPFPLAAGAVAPLRQAAEKRGS